MKIPVTEEDGIPLPLNPQTFIISPEQAADPLFCQKMADIFGHIVTSLGKSYPPSEQ